jgi:hypothetical protein
MEERCESLWTVHFYVVRGANKPSSYYSLGYRGNTYFCSAAAEARDRQIFSVSYFCFSYETSDVLVLRCFVQKSSSVGFFVNMMFDAYSDILR